MGMVGVGRAALSVAAREADRMLENRIKETIRLIADEASWLAASGEDMEIPKPGSARRPCSPRNWRIGRWRARPPGM